MAIVKVMSRKHISLPDRYAEMVVENEITYEKQNTTENIKALLRLYIVNAK